MRFNFKLTDRDIKLSHKGLILVIVPVIFEIVFVGYLVKLLADAEHEIWVEKKIQTMLVESEQLTSNMYDAGRYAFQSRYKSGSKSSAAYDETMAEIPVKLKELKNQLQELAPSNLNSSVIDAKAYQDLVEQFGDVEHSCYVGLTEFRSFKAQIDMKVALVFSVDYEHKLTKFIRAKKDFVTQLEQLQAQAPEMNSNFRKSIIGWIVFGVSFSIGLGFYLADFFNSSTAKRLRVLMDNTARLAKHQPLNPPVEGRDEIGHLDTVFHKMANDLEEASKRKKELVQMVSHDLRTPLMSVQASLQLLSNGALGEMPSKAKDELTIADFSASRLISLINDLLDIDKMEAGKFELVKREADIGWIFERCIRTVKAYADQHKVAIEVPDDDDEVKVYADPDRIAQVVTNLLSNAIKYSEPGSKVEMTYKDMPDAVLVKIIDHGRGIPKEFEQKIFDRFQQVDASDPREKKGTGLGLAICKALIEAHQGTIGVESTNGHGSTFWFRLPKQRIKLLHI